MTPSRLLAVPAGLAIAAACLLALGICLVSDAIRRRNVYRDE